MRSTSGGMDMNASMVARLKELEDGNHRLKKMPAEEYLSRGKKWLNSLLAQALQLQ